jgi:23S rRNA pseudouridine1911/1915/1917 synthase
MTLVADRAERLDRFLAKRLPEHSRSRLARLIDEGLVTVDGAARKRSFELHEGSSVELPDEIAETGPQDVRPAEIDLDVRYEDESMLVVNKPRGMAVHPAPSLREATLVNALLARAHTLSTEAGGFRPGIVHRLDKETTGLLLVAKTDRAHRKLAEQIRMRSADRRYVAWAEGRMRGQSLTVEGPIGRDSTNRQRMAVVPDGKPARTHLRLLHQDPGRCLLACRLETGRTHQIRVHLAGLGLPVLGDPLYGGDSAWPLQLHSCLIRFDHPETGERLTVYAEAPEDFIAPELVARETLEGWC